MATRIAHNPISRSLLLHLGLLMLALLYHAYGPRVQPQFDPITIDIVETSKKFDRAQNRIVQKSAGQEVDQAKPDSFLSDKNRIVDEQRSAALPGEVSAPRAAVPKVKGGSQADRADRGAKTKNVSISDLGLTFTPTAENEYQKERNWNHPQAGEAMAGGEYIQGMKEGEVSALNSKEFVFYSYYERIRTQLDQTWVPILRAQLNQLYSAGRKLASKTDYTTQTMVTLNEKGEIIRVRILEESGAFDLDRAAIDALNRAGPYPNPPKGLIDEDGKIHLRWSFVLKT